MNANIKLHRHVNPTKQAAEFLRILFLQYTQFPILFLSSGGSALTMLEDSSLQVCTSDFTMGVLDERVGVEIQNNNFFQFSQTRFFKTAQEKGVRIFSAIPLSGETKEDIAKRFELSLRTWRSDHPNGKIIITQGIGPDGHTAGIMPCPEDPKRFELLFLRENWVCAYDAAGKNEFPLRVTTTLTFLKEVDCSIVLVKGKEKADILREVLLPKDDFSSIPGRIIHTMRQVDLFTDIVI